MSKKINIIGRRFGRLIVVDEAPSRNGRAMWICQCDCGSALKICSGKDLRCGKILSCGCLGRENRIKNAMIAHHKTNTYDMSGAFGVGYTSNKNEKFYFDKDDYDKIKDYCWSSNNDGYIYTMQEQKNLFMHNLIVGCKYIDHKNGNVKDNRKENLRKYTGSQNAMNRKINKNSKTGIKGVTYNKRDNLYRALITVNKKQILLGNFKNIEDAIKERKEAEEKYFGEWNRNSD